MRVTGPLGVLLGLLMIATGCAGDARTSSTPTSNPAPAELSDAEVAIDWQDVLDNLTGELRAAGYPNPRDDPYELTGDADSAAEVQASYLAPGGYRKQLLELWTQAQGRLPYVDAALRVRIQSAAGPDELWALVADIFGYVIRPMSGVTTTTDEASTTTDEPTTTKAPTTTTAPPPPPTTAPPPPDPLAGETVSQRNARQSAADYLDYTAFSRSGLIEQLEYEGFTQGDATYAVDVLNVDWNEQAAKSAADYLDYTAFSRSGLIEQLVYEGFTQAQAEYGVSTTGL